MHCPRVLIVQDTNSTANVDVFADTKQFALQILSLQKGSASLPPCAQSCSLPESNLLPCCARECSFLQRYSGSSAQNPGMVPGTEPHSAFLLPGFLYGCLSSIPLRASTAPCTLNKCRAATEVGAQCRVLAGVAGQLLLQGAGGAGGKE